MIKEDILKILYAHKDPLVVEARKKKYGINSKHQMLGLTQRSINEIVKKIKGKNSDLALSLYEEEVYEAKVMCSKLFSPKDLTFEIADEWVKDFDTWELCDSFSMMVFAKSPIGHSLPLRYTSSSREYVKRAGFATMAALCSADKKGDNSLFSHFFEVIEEEAIDSRNMVSKAINWALRSLGKRNIDLLRQSKIVASKLSNHEINAARWVGRNALQEFNREKLRISDYPRHIYRPQG